MKWGGIGAGAAIILGGVFWFGIAVGNGTISFSDLSNENASLPTTLDYSSVTQVYNSLRSNYDGKLDTTKLLDGMKAGHAERLPGLPPTCDQLDSDLREWSSRALRNGNVLP